MFLCKGDVDIQNIKRGMTQLEHDTCVRFVSRTHQRDYLDIQPKSGYKHNVSFLLNECCLQMVMSVIMISDWCADAGHIWGHVVADKPFLYSHPSVLYQGSLPMSSCMPWALCMSSHEPTETSMSQSCGLIYGKVKEWSNIIISYF